MKHFNFWAFAMTAICMAACTSEDDLTQSPPVQQEEDVMVPIMFSSNKDNTTRANVTGVAAADSLGRKFVVSGYKGPKSLWSGDSKIVFDNYVVEYLENSAFTTESNVRNWEYVDRTRIKHAIDNGITRQSIKYWDYTQAQYDFIAWSTGHKTAIYEGTPAIGEVLVSAITPATATGTGELAYTFRGKAVDLKDCYIADMVTVKKADYSKKTGDNPVTLTFRQLGTKVRIGIYETIPGYSVRNVQFYTKDGALTDLSKELVDKATIFTTTANDIYTEGIYTVYFPTVDTPTSEDNNQAHIKFSPIGTAQSTVVDQWGTLNYTIAEDGEKTPGNVYSPEYNYYAFYLPNETGTNLNLRVDFVLESIDGSGEVIEVKNAKAQIPLIYTQWKSGFAYTYLFKISDKTDGRTGNYDPTKPDTDPYNSDPNDPAGLYPITFDAVVVNSEADQTQETITTVSTPSITTYQKGSAVVNNDEYKVNGNDIFVTVNENNELVKLSNDDVPAVSKAALYTIPAGSTEAEVVDALNFRDDDAAEHTIKGRSGLVLEEAAYTLVDKIEYGPDGNPITIPTGTDKAMRFTPTANKTYAFVYTKTDPTTTTDKFQAITKNYATAESVSGLYRYALVAAPMPVADSPTADVQVGVKYFPDGTASAGMLDVFPGQTVNNLYLNAAGTSIASGLAKTGTTYYYSYMDGDTKKYKAAHAVAQADFGTSLYVKDSGSGDYVQNTDATPQNGTAYYYKENDDSYTYCVIYPQRTTGLYVIDETADYVACGTTDKAVKGMTYFDKFTQNNGVYYTKVIKVQPALP